MMTRIATVILAGLPAVACAGGVNHRMDCSKVVQLRLGQSSEDVKVLIGEPRFEARQNTIWSVTGKPRTD
jgi:hypothetical protein